MKVLYVGSRLSAQQATDERYRDPIKVCLNNAWRIFPDEVVDYCIYPTDFPAKNERVRNPEDGEPPLLLALLTHHLLH